MAEEQQQTRPELAIQSVYTKDLSFESPNPPHTFKEEWKPEVKLDLQTTTSTLQENVYEVVLHTTVTVTSTKNTAYIAEVKQAGIFLIKNFPEDQMGAVLGSLCPSIIYPYARQRVADVVLNGGFPQLNLAPINFDALYAQQQQQQTKAANDGKSVAGDDSGGDGGDSAKAPEGEKVH